MHKAEQKLPAAFLTLAGKAQLSQDVAHLLAFKVRSADIAIMAVAGLAGRVCEPCL